LPGKDDEDGVDPEPVGGGVEPLPPAPGKLLAPGT
jgi:hypothetical protein